MKPITRDDEPNDGEGLFSNRRRQRSARPASAKRSKGAGFLSGTPGRILLTLLGGLGVGYLIATLILFPAAEAPTDLIEIPNLRGMTDTDAVAEIENAGLLLGSLDSLLLQSEPAGTVIGQSPLPGQFGTDSTLVRLTISAGAALTLVPDVIGMSLERAGDLLEASGLAYAVDTVESTEPAGVVIGSSPSVGEGVELPATVSLEISEGAPTVEVPNLVGLEEAAAIAMIDSVGLSVGEVEDQFRFGLDQGKVIQQEPAPGVTLERGAPIRLVVGRRGGDEHE